MIFSNSCDSSRNTATAMRGDTIVRWIRGSVKRCRRALCGRFITLKKGSTTSSTWTPFGDPFALWRSNPEWQKSTKKGLVLLMSCFDSERKPLE